MTKNFANKPLVGLIPAAGRATRLAPFPCPKELFPIGYQDFKTTQGLEQRPKVISQYLVENLCYAGVERIFLILGESKHDIARYYGDGKRFGVDIAYLYQEQLSGMPGALDLAWPWLSGQEIDVLFGMPDTILEPRDAFRTLLTEHRLQNADLVLGLFPTTNPSKFGMVDFTADGKVLSTIDKPKFTHLTHMWGFACWSPNFTRLLHEFVSENSQNPKEIVLGDAFNLAIKRNLNVRAVTFDDGLYMDIGTSNELDAALKKFHL